MPWFEVAIYNTEVRRLVYEGDHHNQLADEWAETHYIEISARDVDEARLRAQARYPSHRGFVIEAVSEA